MEGRMELREVGSTAKCESPTFAGICPSEAPLARTYRHLDLDERRTLFRMVEAVLPREVLAKQGMTLDQIGQLLALHPVEAEVHHAGDSRQPGRVPRAGAGACR